MRCIRKAFKQNKNPDNAYRRTTKKIIRYLALSGLQLSAKSLCPSFRVVLLKIYIYIYMTLAGTSTGIYKHEFILTWHISTTFSDFYLNQINNRLNYITYVALEFGNKNEYQRISICIIK